LLSIIAGLLTVTTLTNCAHTTDCRHGEGVVFSHIKALSTQDPLLGGGNIVNMQHEREYRQLSLAIIANLSCEQQLYEELEGQVLVLREFLGESAE
jgi:hypothetical protein